MFGACNTSEKWLTSFIQAAFTVFKKQKNKTKTVNGQGTSIDNFHKYYKWLMTEKINFIHNLKNHQKG